MPREQFQNLTEPMYYILLALLEESCGVDIMDKVNSLSKGRVQVGPGTLYSLLGKFQDEHFIKETKVEGRKRSYIITKSGLDLLLAEYRRLNVLIEDGKERIEHYDKK